MPSRFGSIYSILNQRDYYRLAYILNDFWAGGRLGDDIATMPKSKIIETIDLALEAIIEQDYYDYIEEPGNIVNDPESFLRIKREIIDLRRIRAKLVNSRWK